MTIPTFVDGIDGELVLVCATCLEANAEDGTDWCSTCLLGGEGVEDDDEDLEVRGVPRRCGLSAVG